MDHQGAGQAQRSGNAAATRAAILVAAQACFAEDSYERVGVRDIAARAGITGALVIRYFGSKERLFEEALRQAMQDLRLDRVMAGDRARLGERLARYAVQARSIRPLLTILRAAPNAQSAALLREITHEQFVYPLAARLEGDQTVQRAALVGAYLIGFSLHYHALQSESLASCEKESLVDLIAPILQSYIDGAPGKA